MAATRVVCPSCKAVLTSARPVLPGRIIRCPRCSKTFAAVSRPAGTPRKPALLPAPAPAPRPATTLRCPGCKVTLRSSIALPPGRKVKCPRCAVLIPVPARPLPPKTKLAPQARQTRLAPTKAPPVRLTCPACKAVMGAARLPPPGKPIACLKCKRTFRLAPKRTVLAAASPRPTKLAAAPRQTMLAPAPVKTPAPRVMPKTAPVRQVRPRVRGHHVRFAILLLLLTALGIGGFVLYQRFESTAIPASAWVEFAPPEGQCRLLMPGSPVAREVVMHGPGLRSGNKYTVLREREDMGFFLTCAPGAKASFDDVYAAERDYLLKALKGRLTREADVSRGSLVGKELQAETTGGGVVLARLYRAGDRYYLLLAGGPKLRAGQGDAARFFDSFAVAETAGHGR